MNPGHASTPLLDVRDLRVTLATAQGRVDALRGVSFALERENPLGPMLSEECLALVNPPPSSANTHVRGLGC